MTEKRLYELVPYDCQDGSCLMIHEKTTDSKLGALSLDHRSIGEAIVDELNDLSEKWYNEQMRTISITLDTHISDDDFKRIEEMFIKHFERGCGMIENKRFTNTQGFGEHHWQIRDNGKIIMDCSIESQAESMVKLLNELHEENEELKQSIDNIGGRLQGLWAHYNANRHGIWGDAVEDVAKELGFKIYKPYDAPISMSNLKKERINGAKKLTEIIYKNEINELKQENEELKQEKNDLKTSKEYWREKCLSKDSYNKLYRKAPIWFTQSAKLTDKETGKIAKAIEQDLKERRIKE